VGDDPAAVAVNRRLLVEALNLPSEPRWLEQVHGIRVAGRDWSPGCAADAAVTDQPGEVCVVMTADCLPVLLCNRAGTRVAVAHAGWRGLAAGVLERSVAAFPDDPAEVMAWLGPAIGPDAFEVGEEVRRAFCANDPGAAVAFEPSVRSGHWLADLYALARRRLGACGVTAVYGGGECTYGDAERFFSFRRDGTTGRMATLVWLTG
jgi:YfiH family protein